MKQPIGSFLLIKHLAQGGWRAWPTLETEALWEKKEQAGNTAFCLIIPAFRDFTFLREIVLWRAPILCLYH